jgi:hypothetical protein
MATHMAGEQPGIEIEAAARREADHDRERLALVEILRRRRAVVMTAATVSAAPSAPARPIAFLAIARIEGPVGCR